jgi:hypothetical protein
MNVRSDDRKKPGHGQFALVLGEVLEKKNLFLSLRSEK